MKWKMTLRDLLDKVRGAASHSIPETEEADDDDGTLDKTLIPLRKARQRQMEEVEKLRLRKEIDLFKKEREKKYLWGTGADSDKVLSGVKREPTQNLLKQKNVMIGSSSMFGGKRKKRVKGLL